MPVAGTPAEPSDAVAAAAELSADDDTTSIETPADDWSDLVANITDDDDTVSEPAGWGSSPESAVAATAEAATPVVEEPALPTVETASSAVADAGAAAVTAETATSATDTAAAAGAAPAGWYADPSSRFELRYWDGSQWTEHVSRAGQQYTDPPVA